MKIAYLVNTYPRGSQTFIRREIAAHERAGVPVHRFALRSDRAALTDPADLAEDDRTEHVLAKGLAPLVPDLLAAMTHPGSFWQAFRLAMACGARGVGGGDGTGGLLRHMVYLAEAARVARRCRALGVTHLHAHFGTNSATVAMLAHALGGPPFSFTAHGPEEFDGPRALALDIKLDRAAVAVAVSSFGRSQLCRWTGRWDRLHVVHCGIEPDQFPPPVPMPTGGPHLVAVGRLAEQKGFGLLIEALARLVDLPDLRLTLVGDGPMRGALERAAAPLGHRVTFAGWQDGAGVRAALDQAQALVVPSFAEGLPVVIMEAMAAGRPVISTAIAGIPELVLPGHTGWLVPSGDPQALAQAIRDLAITPGDRLAAMGMAGRARVLDRHDIDREAAKLRSLIARG